MFTNGWKIIVVFYSLQYIKKMNVTTPLLNFLSIRPNSTNKLYYLGNWFMPIIFLPTNHFYGTTKTSRSKTIHLLPYVACTFISDLFDKQGNILTYENFMSCFNFPGRANEFITVCKAVQLIKCHSSHLQRNCYNPALTINGYCGVILQRV